MKPIITKEMKLGDLIINYPRAAEILFEEGFHCLGCGAAHFETIEEGLLAHGKSQKEIEKIIEKMNKIISDESKK